MVWDLWDFIGKNPYSLILAILSTLNMIVPVPRCVAKLARICERAQE
jgi:hypothetical protein